MGANLGYGMWDRMHHPRRGVKARSRSALSLLYGATQRWAERAPGTQEGTQEGTRERKAKAAYNTYR